MTATLHRSRVAWPALALAFVLAVPSLAHAAAGERGARTAVARLAQDVARSLSGKTARRLASKLRGFSRSVRGSRACAALGAVESARLELRKARRALGRLRRDVGRAEHALLRLPAAGRCAPRTRQAKISAVHPSFNPNLPKGPNVHGQGGEEEFRVSRGRHYRPTGPQGAQTQISRARRTGAFSANLTDPLQILTSTDLGPAPCCAYPQEPQVAKAGDVVLYSGNTLGYASTNGGDGFTSMDPNRVFGNDAGEPICCDTVVRYAPQIDRFLWLMQYLCPPPIIDCNNRAANKNNRYRLAVVSPQSLRDHRSDPAAAAWTVFDLTTQRYQSSTWFDYPDMAVGRDYLYLTWDLVGQGTANTRVRLSDLTRPGALNVDWFRGTDIFYRVAQNPGTTGYFVKVADSDDDAAYIWPDAQPMPLLVSLPHLTRPGFDYASYTPTGQNWTDRVGSPIVKGATVRADELWVAASAGRSYNANGTGRRWPQPFIQVGIFDTSDLGDIMINNEMPLIHNRLIWSATDTYADPVLATNSEGDVGITFAYGNPHSQPTPAVGVLTGNSYQLRAAFSRAPAIVVQGDYAGLQPDWPDATRFVAANTLTTFGTGGVGAHWLFTRFGRAPAGPARVGGRNPTSIAITRVTSTLYDCCFTGDTLNFDGQVQGAPPGSQVRITYRPPSGLQFDHTVTASDEGNFHDSVPSGPAGVWKVFADYFGDSQYGASESDPFYVSVSEPPG